MVGTWPKASTKCGLATKQAAHQPLKLARRRPGLGEREQLLFAVLAPIRTPYGGLKQKTPGLMSRTAGRRRSISLASALERRVAR